jgi:elongator complex protein 2
MCVQCRVGLIGGSAVGYYSAAFVHSLNSTQDIIASGYSGGVHRWRHSALDDDYTACACDAVWLGGHTDAVADVCWDPHGAYVLSVSADQTTRLYAPLMDFAGYGELARPQVHGHDMHCCACVTSGCFVSAGDEKLLRVFRAPQAFVDSWRRLCAVDGDDQLFAAGWSSASVATVPALGLSNKCADSEDGDVQMTPLTGWCACVCDVIV